MNNKKYFPLAGRLIVQNLTTPETPAVIEFMPQADYLGHIELSLAVAGMMDELGVRIINNGIVLYPAPGSINGLGAAGVGYSGMMETYGPMPPTGLSLVIPFNQRLRGKPSVLRFEFYNNHAANDAPVNILIASYNEVEIRDTAERREPEKVNQ